MRAVTALAGRTRGPRGEAVLALVAALLLAAPAVASAGAAAPPQEAPARAGAGDVADLDARTARVADQLRCPVCRSQSVLESSSTLAREMKAEIRRRLAEGQSPEEVKSYFVSRYGEWILLRPEARGLNLVVYVVPPILLLGGGLLVWWLVRRWRPRTAAAGGGGGGTASTGGAPAPFGDGLSEAEERRLSRALRDAENGG